MRAPLKNRRVAALVNLTAATALLLASWQMTTADKPRELDIAELESVIGEKTLADVVVSSGGRQITGKVVAGGDEFAFIAYYPAAYEEKLIEQLDAAQVTYKAQPPVRRTFGDIAMTILPLLLFLVLIWWVMSRSIGGAKGFGVLGGRKLVPVERPSGGFSELGGIEETVRDLQEIVTYLRHPERFQRIGARPPKGVLLVGEPGCGKTALARAVAAEANVPFFSLSGSDFVEMFVGVGASRVRALFEQAKSVAPAIIFIDEIDAVGRRRSSGSVPGSDERDQTLNQLLVEMDGFEADAKLLVIAATNRPDVLDPALTRTGRFDRRVVIPLPDRQGRREILAIHAAKLNLHPGVDLETVAARTTGLSGADLENVLNEAALAAARRNADVIENVDMEEALDRVLLGPARRSAQVGDEDRRISAYHEAGHTLCAWFTPGAATPHKVTIIPRGRSGGATWMIPAERSFMSERAGMSSLVAGMGGRAAEELVAGEEGVTSGAAHDIQQGTELARAMVAHFGMVPEIGPVWYGDGQTPPGTAEKIEAAVRRLMDEALDRARQLLREHRDQLDLLAQKLLEMETLDYEHLEELLGPSVNPRPSAREDIVEAPAR